LIKVTDRVPERGGFFRQYLSGIAVLFLVFIIFFHQSLFFGRGLSAADGIFMWPPWRNTADKRPSNYLLADQYLSFTPQQHFFHEQLRNGRFALWNPYCNCGIPLAGSMQTAIFFPLNLAFSFFDPFTVSGLKAFLKLFLCGVFMLLYMSRLGVGRWAGLFSALVFSMCSFMIVWLGHPHTNCAMWLPLLLYIIECEFGRRADAASNRRSFVAGLRRWVGFSVVFCFMILGGHPPTIVHISLVITVYFCFRLFCERKDGVFGRHILFFVLGVSGGLLLAAPQILTFLEYYRVSSLPVSSAGIGRWRYHLHISALINLFIPYLGGSPVHGFEGLLRIADSRYNFNERIMFMGVVPLCMSVFVFFYKRNRFVIFYFILSLFCLCTIFGLWPVPSIIRFVPVLNGINQMRLILIVCFSVAVLSGFGFEGLGRIRFSVRWRVLAGLLIVFGAVLLWAYHICEHVFSGPNPGAVMFVRGQLRIFISCIAAVCVVVLYPRRSGGLIPGFLALGWVCFELLWFGMGYNPSIRRCDYYPVTEGIRFLQRDDSLFRIASLDGVLVPNTAGIYGLYDIRGRDFMTVRNYEQFIKGRAGHFFFYSPMDPLPARLGNLNVKYLLTDKDRPMPHRPVYKGEISIYRVEPFVERAFLVFDYEVLSERSQILQKVRSEDFDPLKVVVLECQPAVVSGKLNHNLSGGHSAVEITSYDSDEVVIEVSTEKSGFLVLNDTYYPGWKAYIDGKRTEIYRANYNFRAVCMPAGASVVRFRYRPASFAIGCSFSLGIIIFIVGVFIYSRKRNIFVF